MPFADRLILAVRRLGHPLCVGLDPHLDRLPPIFRRALPRPTIPTHPENAAVVGEFLAAVVDRLEGRVAIVKPQIAFFEQLGWRGLQVLAETIELCRRRKILVLTDAKRGDIGSTATAYARAFFGENAAWPSDALTVSPYLGLDTLEPFIERAAENDGGLFVLVRTSNPGAADLQDVRIQGDDKDEDTDEPRTLHLNLASKLAERAERLAGPETGWSGLGAVVGATWPEDAERVREHLPRSLFLVPGYGAQGGAATDAVRGFVRGPHGGLEGGIVNSSRGILFPPAAAEADDAQTWERAIDEAIDRAVDDLGSAVA